MAPRTYSERRKAVILMRPDATGDLNTHKDGSHKAPYDEVSP